MTSPPLNQGLETINATRKEAAEALRRVQTLSTPLRFTPFCVGDRVWLEAKNLNTTHPMAKLTPRCHGPFLVTAAISHVSYQLKLPTTWKIHNVFHASLLTPYKETTINRQQYQEPTPDLVDGQPEWEVEHILGARKRRNQLQYLVRWKGFSEAHDSWEPLTHINADQRIREFYQNNPLAIRTSIKETTPPLSITIRHTIMSTPNSPSTPPTEIPALAYPPSPQPLMVPPRLEDRIEDPPAVLTLGERLENTESEGALIMHRDPSPPIRPQTPEGYVRYDPTDPNHARQVKKIHLHRSPHDSPQFPYYVHFVHDMTAHQHYVYRLMDDEGPHTTPYGWPMEAKPFQDPIPHLDTTIDNAALGIFDARYAKSLEVDASLYALRDYRALADVDKYRSHMLDYKDLLLQQAQVERDLCTWRTAIAPI